MIEMETRSSANKFKEKEKEINEENVMAELMKKVDITNKLLEELIDVVKGSQFTNLDFDSDVFNNLENTEETNVKTIEDNSYQSPALQIHKEREELVLRNAAYRIKQNIKAEWSRILNYRKQAYWKQINNANHAEYFEKWLNQESVVSLENSELRKFEANQMNKPRSA